MTLGLGTAVSCVAVAAVGAAVAAGGIAAVGCDARAMPPMARKATVAAPAISQVFLRRHQGARGFSTAQVCQRGSLFPAY